MAHMGDFLAEMLIAYGVKCVFGMPGGQTSALYEGISTRQSHIRHVLVRDERNAVYAADAFARMTGRPGVCDVTVGPGCTKLTDGFVEALNASVPMIAIVGELPRDWLPLKAKGVASQGFDQLGFLKSISKDAWTVPTTSAFPEMVRLAFRAATAPRPGPVALIIPHDIFDADWDADSQPVMTDDRYTRAPAHRSRPLPEPIDLAVEQIGRAKRPLIVAGGGVHWSGAYNELEALAQKADAVVATSLTGKGAFCETSRRSVGVLNPMGSRAALALAPAADLIVWCGSKASQNTANNWTLPTAEQATITIDDDPQEHGRTFRPTVALFGDVRSTLQELTPRLTRNANAEWLERAEAENRAHQAALEEDMNSDVVPLHPGRVLREIAARLGPDDIVVSDASFASGWIGQYLPARKASRRFLYARGQGSLGYAVPGSLGAALSEPGTRIITVSGDGGFSFYLGELATQAQLGLPIVNVVFNNGVLGWLAMWEQVFYNNTRLSVDLESNRARPSYAAAATGLGLKGLHIDSPNDIAKALDEAFGFDGASVVEVRTDPNATPIHSLRRRLQDPNPDRKRPGTVYQLRNWKRSRSL